MWHVGEVEREQRSVITGGTGITLWMTGLSGSGKSTIAHGVEFRLIGDGRLAYVLDGDNLRTGINADLGFSAVDRAENVRRVGEIARLMNDAGLVVLVPVISPFVADRAAVRARHSESGHAFAEIHVHAPLEVCEARDPKGLYSRARAGEISDFTGIDSPYEAPCQPELVIDTSTVPVDAAVDVVLEFLGRRE